MFGFRNRYEIHKHPWVNYALAITIPLLKHCPLLTMQLGIQCKMSAQTNEPENQHITFLFHEIKIKRAGQYFVYNDTNMQVQKLLCTFAKN